MPATCTGRIGPVGGCQTTSEPVVVSRWEAVASGSVVWVIRPRRKGEVRNPDEPPKIYVWKPAAAWGRAEIADARRPVSHAYVCAPRAV